ncbi:hypothetical protein Metev_2335 (plasmid) [Methanohalobium evestigatum Z-7303]|uniref:PGF-CTERM archaeal protein-sorting signal domain-containing protein n=1 Tax=Methanohalobium evestigatum (strain ATCC BAA-1072 / DSM 3721 / NBRC 107634 / OCM 161 / Z-7303) TaxID=644295 RepID=D7EC25_METEZ|nr:TIGR04279 domain-containing protein [Methanohalobium evestigatum]ADI75147.1 hypothetical protein Metev_2335 [Methanohalobium evestigatum Z-7303]
MKKSWIFLTTIILIITFTSVANAAEMNDEYIMNATLKDNSFLFANHNESRTEGNWISLGGGEPVQLPTPIKFTYHGVNETSFSTDSKNVDIKLNVKNYTDYVIEYPFETHQMYTNTSGKNNVTYQFNGSKYFANKETQVVLIESDIGSLTDILDKFRQGQIDSINDITSLDKVNSLETKDLDDNGDTNGEFGNLDAGEYSVLIILRNEPVILSATAFDVLDYESSVNENIYEGKCDVNIGLIDAPDSVNYTYAAALIKQSEYKTVVSMNFNGSKSGLNLSVNNEPVVDKFNLLGLNISNLNRTDIKNRVTDFIDEGKLSAQLKSIQSNNTTISLDTNDLESGKYVLFSGAVKDNNIVAFNQSFISLGQKFKISVDDATKSVEQNQDAIYDLKIKNIGLKKETINLTKTKVRGVNAEFNESQISVMPDETKIIKLKVSSSQIGKNYPVIVKASAVGSEKRQVIATRTTVIDALDVDVDSTTKTTATNTNATYTFTVTNTGNQEHTFNISSTNPSDIGILKNDSITLKGGQSDTVEYVVNSSSKGVYVSDITVNESTNHNITETLFVITNVKDKTETIYGFSLSTDVKTKPPVDVNKNATYNITITNTGNQKDTYDLTVISPRTNNTSLNNSKPVNLNPGEKTFRKLNVSAPVSGDYNVKVVGVSQNSSKMDKVNTLTKVKDYGVILTADSYSATANPGNTVNYTVNVKNTGNVEDDFKLTNKTNIDSIEMPSVIKNVKPGKTESFDVAISNPDSGNYNANITAISKSYVDISNSVNLSLNVSDKPDHSVSVTANPISEVTENNENVTYILNIKNTGNIKDTYEISSELTDANIVDNKTTLYPGESTSITVNVSGFNDSNIYSIPVKVKSSDSGVEKQITLYAEVISAVDITATPGTQTTKGHNASSYTIKVTNTGVHTHTYDLKVADNSSNTTANLAINSIPDLNPGESTTVDFTFNNTQDTDRRIEAVIKAEVQNNPEKSATTSVSTLYLEQQNVYGVSIDAETKQQNVGKDKNATYFLELKNLGNTNNSFNLEIVEGKEKYTTFKKKSVDLNASGTNNDTEIIKLTHYPEGVGEHTVKINANSSNSNDTVEDTVELTTRIVAPPINSEIIKSVVDGQSAVKNSTIDPSTVKNSLINNTNITDSTVKNSKLVGSTIIDSNLNNIEFRNGHIENNKIYNGTLVVDGTEFVVKNSQDPIHLSNIIIGVDNFDSSLSGIVGENTEIAAENSNVRLTIGSDRNYVGGTLSVQRSNIASNGTSKLSDNVGGYVTIEESDSINESYVKLNFSYNQNDVVNVDENDLYIYWYNENKDKWVPLKSAGNPDFCKSVNRNIEENYVTATVTHLSTYSIGPVEETETKQPDGPSGDSDDGVSGGSSGSSSGSGEPYENIADKSVKMKYLNKNDPVKYEFEEKSNPIKSVEYTPLINAGYVDVVVEMLKDTSTFVDNEPKGNVYKNLNIFIGKGKWAEKGNLENLTISFSVNKSWIDRNNVNADDVILSSYDESWNKLSTTKISEDSNKVYYRANIPEYSPFMAINTDKQSESDKSTKSSKSTDNIDDTNEKSESGPGQSEGIPGFKATFTLVGMVTIAYLIRRIK